MIAVIPIEAECLDSYLETKREDHSQLAPPPAFIRGDDAERIFAPLGIICRHEFCFECLVPHRKVVQRDNSAHMTSCMFHPANMNDG